MARFRPSDAHPERVVMRPTSLLSLAGLVVVGVIIADFLIHPAGTQAAANGLVNIEKVGGNALLGQTS